MEIMQRVKGRRLTGRADGLYRSNAKDDFVTHAVDALDLSFEGIQGDRHAGTTRCAGAREPWYPRGTAMRNDRQLTLLAPDELKATADALDIPEIRPEWIGGNLLVSGIADLTWLPPRTLLFFAGGVTLKIDGENIPCRVAGRSIAEHHENRADVELGFVKAAQHRRGLVAWVERPGRIDVGERVEARLPEHWIYG